MLIISFLSFFIFYFFLVYKKSFIKIFNDNDFKKPQSFHLNEIPRVGGLLVFFTILTIFLNSEFNINQDIVVIIGFSLVAFLIGFLDDIKLSLTPIFRFALFFVLFIILIIFFEIKIKNFNFFILDYLNHIFIFSLLITFLAIFFIVNGANLIDGFNGLLSIHSIIILLILFNTYKISFEMNQYLLQIIFCICLFIIFNFPKAKIFLGDSGAYFIGSNLALIGILLSNQNDKIPPFLLANIFFYLFFEIFFSVFRKIFQKKNPFYPDRNHLHMLLFFYISKNIKKNANPLTSILINFIYIIVTLPSILFFNVKYFCELVFVVQILIYVSSYLILKKKTN